MKKLILTLFCFLLLISSFNLPVFAQCRGGSCSSMTYIRNSNKWSPTKKMPEMVFYIDSSYVYPVKYYEEDEELKQIGAWERKGLEFFIGSNAYFASKKTANYYNGAPENDINLHTFLNNKYRFDTVRVVMKEAYPHILENIELSEEYNYNSSYHVAMDIAIGFRYRVHRNWYFELDYSFRKLTASNFFIFDFPGVPPSNIEKPYYLKHYSRPQGLLAKEDRHYIDFSVGYILQKPKIAKPFLSIGVQFNYIRIKEFLAIIENRPFDLMDAARYPNTIPGHPEMPVYMDWAGPGYGFTLTAGLKIAFHPAVSIDPIFQLSATSLGNNRRNLPGFYTDFCFNYLAGVRLVLNDALFLRNK